MKTKVPKLRFPEFSGEWEEKKLGEISSNIMYGMNAAATNFDGQNKYIRITDISETNNKFIPSPLSSPLGDIEDKFLVSKNDILFARTGASTGKSYLYSSKDGKLYYAGFLIRFNINIENNSKFIFYQTLNEKYKNWLKITSMRSGQPGINAEEYKEYKVFLSSLPEQEKIASFLSKVDESIEILEEEKELWEKYKKGMMQKIFNQELRFKDENGNDYPEWEEKQLGEIGNIITGSTPETSKMEYYGGEYLFISPIDINSNRYVKTTKTTLTKAGFLRGRKIPKMSICFVCIGSTIGKIAQNFEDCITNQQINSIVPFENISADFIYSLLEYNSNKIKLLAAEQAVPLINKTDFSKIKINFPSLPEQEKIANFLSSIDEKIELIEKELEGVKEFKKGLLQQMFI